MVNSFKVRRAKDDEYDDILLLDRILLPDSPVPSEDTELWVAVDPEDEIVAYAGARQPWPGYCFFSRTGVLPQARGMGLQKRLIRARVKWAQKQGYKACLTYTSTDNAPSMRSLISCGFRPYDPSTAYVGDGFVYWKLPIGAECK